ncbi:MAG: cupredoxin domain-containing protein [Nitrososphaerota archaeon]|nr:cupredoxin domain-containing protein [Nitrososphaerota archaeon]MDG7023413.1 cupredoxin domain-containing protein [Nitrososphaerota archaeon]
MSTQSPSGAHSSVAVGAVVAILIVGAVATLGYYQFFVANTTTTTTTTATTPSVTCPSAACVNVTIFAGASSQPSGYTQGQTTTYGYTPDTVIVVIGKNNTVFWTNDDAAPHTVTSETGAPVSFDSGTSGPLLTQGGTYQFTFTVPGTYHYHCSFHAWMQGTVIVKAAS